MFVTNLIIDNETRPSSDGARFGRTDCRAQQEITNGAAATVTDAIDAAESANAAFAGWSGLGPTARRKILLRMADEIENRTDEFVASMAGEIGASPLWAGFNVHLGAACIREAASLATQMTGETIPSDKPGAISMTVRQPAGVVLSIAPWNGPIVLAARAIAYPLAFGNTVVLRGSEVSPRTHALVVEAGIAAGLPPGVLNFVTNASKDSPQIIDALIAHPAVRRINFTGSTHVGRIIASKAGFHLKRCLLELGGKSPFVVLQDADIDAAVEAACFGAFFYQGQICMSTERIVVESSIADDFVERFQTRVHKMNADAANDSFPQTIISPENGHRLNVLLDDALAKGAVMVTGGRAAGAAMDATIVDHVTPEMKIYDEESFGPVTTIVRVANEKDAARVANDTSYGLSASVFGSDLSRTLSVALAIDSGSCHVNGATVQDDPQAPFGGTKASGYGRFGGRAVIEEFTELKWITIEPPSQPYPI